MQLICFNIDHIIDFITNSSSELFVMKSDNKDIVISLIESVFPDFRKGFHEPMQYKDMPEDIFAKCIETIYDSYAKEKEDLFLFSGYFLSIIAAFAAANINNKEKRAVGLRKR